MLGLWWGLALYLLAVIAISVAAAIGIRHLLTPEQRQQYRARMETIRKVRITRAVKGAISGQTSDFTSPRPNPGQRYWQAARRSAGHLFRGSANNFFNLLPVVIR